MRSLPALLATVVALVGASSAAHADDASAAAETVHRAIHVCAACHGEEGQSKDPAIPSLAGQSPQYMKAQLKDFRGQTRAETGTRAYMWGVSALLDDAVIAGLADYYGGLPAARGRPGPPALVAAGRQIFNNGIPARHVRACASCHGDKAEGQAAFPRLAGQHADYVFAQLKVFSTKLRPHGVLMKGETQSMTPAELRAVAAYVQSL